MSFGLYRANSVIIVFGFLTLEDMRADTFVKVTAADDMFKVVKGSDGSITRVCTHNTHYQVEATFKSSSKENAKLSAIHNTDAAQPGGSGVLGFGLYDKSKEGTTRAASEKCWIRKLADFDKGVEVGSDVTWLFDAQCLPGQIIVGGNQE